MVRYDTILNPMMDGKMQSMGVMTGYDDILNLMMNNKI